MSWTLDDIPPLGGRTYLVTGANSGIGFVTAQALAGRGAQVILACRHEARASAAVAAIRGTHPGSDVSVELVDLADLASVRALGERVRERHQRLDGLLNNAGVASPPPGHSADGYEVHLAVNVLGPYALTGLLLPLLEATAGARVVSMSSIGHRFAPRREPVTEPEAPQRGPLGLISYFETKLAILHFAYELERRLRHTGARTSSLGAHPGISRSDLGRDSRAIRLFVRLCSQDTAVGALPLLRAATDPALTGGLYLGPGGALTAHGPPTVQRSSARSYAGDPARRLWGAAGELTGVTYLNRDRIPRGGV